MAFDHEDTERFYDRIIVPALKQKRIACFRVDRSNRNDDIDDQILEELRQADFVISDLTYARPSVYFEAGVAHGQGLEVIYTCRSDHFKPQASDVPGNLRVHFDLQMKPIIAWTDARGSAVMRRLGNRISRVTRPLIVRREQSEATDRERQEFARLSQVEQGKRIRSLYVQCAKAAGFTIAPVTMEAGAGTVGTRSRRQVHQSARIWVYRTFTGSDVQRIQNWRWVGVDRRANYNSRSLVQALEEHEILCALERIPVSRVTAALPGFRVTRNGSEILASNDIVTVERRAGRTDPDGVPCRVRFHVISGIQSEREWKSALEDILRTLGRDPAKDHEHVPVDLESGVIAG